MSYRQLVVFALGNEEYGVEISYVQEIIRIPHITIVPDMPPYMEGIINLRGKVIPVIDLKKRFGFDSTVKLEDSRLMVLNIEKAIISVIVDDVSEVFRLDEQAIESLPSEIVAENGNSLQEIGKLGERLLLLLDVRKTFKDSYVVRT